MSDLTERPTPVGTPSIDEMPLTQSVPVCEWNAGYLAQGAKPCWRAADLRVRSHISFRDASVHGDLVVLTCTEHFEEYREWWEDVLARYSNPVCAICEKPYRHIGDVILSVIPL